MKGVRLSALRTGRLYPPGVVPGTNFYWRLSRPQGHSAAGRIMSVKSLSDPIWNRTRESRPLTYNIFCSAACFQTSLVCILLPAGGKPSFWHLDAAEVIVLHTWIVLILGRTLESRKVLYPGLSYVMCAVVCVCRLVSFCEEFAKELYWTHEINETVCLVSVSVNYACSITGWTWTQHSE